MANEINMYAIVQKDVSFPAVHTTQLIVVPTIHCSHLCCSFCCAANGSRQGRRGGQAPHVALLGHAQHDVRLPPAPNTSSSRVCNQHKSHLAGLFVCSQDHPAAALAVHGARAGGQAHLPARGPGWPGRLQRGRAGLRGPAVPRPRRLHFYPGKSLARTLTHTYSQPCALTEIQCPKLTWCRPPCSYSQYEVSDDQDSVQMLQRSTQVGEFYRMSPPAVWDMNATLPPSYMDIM